MGNMSGVWWQARWGGGMGGWRAWRDGWQDGWLAGSGGRQGRVAGRVGWRAWSVGGPGDWRGMDLRSKECSGVNIVFRIFDLM